MLQSDSSNLTIENVKEIKNRGCWTGDAETFQTWYSTKIGFAARLAILFDTVIRAY